MKKLLILFVLTNITFAQNNWQVVKQATLDVEAEEGFFIDENTGWLGGVKGIIYATIDCGATWTVQRDSLTGQGDINNIYFIDSNYGWACGDDATLLYTTNGGATWTQSTNVSTTEDLWGIDFVSTTVGYACGDGGVIIKTTNGGLNWVLQITPTTQKIYRIEFFDNNNGIAIIKTNVSSTLWTNSGGFVWGFASFTAGTGKSTMHDCDVVRGTSRAWIIGFHGNVHYSTDKGQHWTLSAAFYGTRNAFATAIDFTDANTGYAGGEFGSFFRTTDGGVNWDTVSTGSGNRIIKINALNTNDIIAVGTDNQIRKSNDGGNSWTPIIDWPMDTFQGIGIADSLNITCYTSRGDMTFSNNAGNNFSFPGNENLPTTSLMFCLDFYNMNLGFYGASGGDIAKSIDGGTSWYLTNVTGANELRRIHSFYIYNQNIAWAGAGSGGLGIHGRVYKTTDGGENWTEVAALDEIIYGVYFLDDQIGYAVGEHGRIFKCTDGNTSWSLIDSVGEKDLNAIDFIDSQIGYVVSWNGILGKTSDGGNTWDVVDTLGYVNDSTAINELWDIHFVDSNEGWITSGDIYGNNGAFYHTMDGGNTWQKIESPNGKSIEEIEFFSPDYGWASGDYGSIFKYDATTGIGNDSPNGKLESFSLYSNYPNPFNPVTNIKYYLNISGDAELSIYNVQGQKIRTLIKEFQTPGAYNFTWDAKNENGSRVSSGMYFYQIKLDNEVHAKRMILLK